MNRANIALYLLSVALLVGCGESPNGKSKSASTAPVIEATPAGKKPDAETAAATQPKVRKVTFHYGFKVKGLQRSDNATKDLVRMWLPCPTNNDCQEINLLAATAPTTISEHDETKFGNKMLYLETLVPESGEFVVDVPYEVTRHEVLRKPGTPSLATKEILDDMNRALYLSADKMVPTDGKALTLLASADLSQDKLHLARQLYDIVDAHVVYKKVGTGWGRGDTNWVCDSGYGNCTDFHSLFMTLARSQGLPTRFEIGFSIPTDKTEGPVVGYHCWAWFYVDEHGWIPVDISEADKHPEMKEYYFGDLTADRVMFSSGRDLDLVPKSDQSPLNFFIYPHIEVGGKPLAKENVELQFTYKDSPN